MMFKAAAVQFNVTTGDKEYNMQRAEELLCAAGQSGAKLILLPELWNTGYDLQNIDSCAEDSRGEAVCLMQKIAKEYQTTIIGGSIIERRNNNIYNTCFVIDATGRIAARYRKVHLFTRYMQENLYFTAGEEWGFFSYPHQDERMKIGLSLCYDLRFPEFYRNMALRGARMFAVPAAWPSKRIREYQLFCRSRAAENRSFLIGTNYTDTSDGTYCGGAIIVSPYGDVLVQGDNDEGVYSAVIDSGIYEKPYLFTSIDDRQPFLDEIDNSLI